MEPKHVFTTNVIDSLRLCCLLRARLCSEGWVSRKISTELKQRALETMFDI